MDLKHSNEELKQLQALPLAAKITRTKALIRTWYEHFDGMVYVGFSGGKDSTVLKHIVDSLYKDVPSVFVNTGLEYPEIQKFVKECQNGDYEVCGLNNNVEIIYPEKKFKDVISENGYPVISKELAQKIYEARSKPDGFAAQSFAPNSEKNIRYPQYSLVRYSALLNAPFKISHKCCLIMKKAPSKAYEKREKRHPILGTMATESRARRVSWQQTGCNAFGKNRPTSNPLSFWTENDVLTYIADTMIPIAKVYKGVDWNGGKFRMLGVRRTGCMFCMFGCLSADDNRFTAMRESHPIQYEYCMRSVADGGLGLKDVIDWINENGNLKNKIKY